MFTNKWTLNGRTYVPLNPPKDIIRVKRRNFKRFAKIEMISYFNVYIYFYVIYNSRLKFDIPESLKTKEISGPRYKTIEPLY